MLPHKFNKYNRRRRLSSLAQNEFQMMQNNLQVKYSKTTNLSELKFQSYKIKK